MLDTIKLKEKHEERHRDGETFECESCDRTFKNEKNLSHHIKMHHTSSTRRNRPSADIGEMENLILM